MFVWQKMTSLIILKYIYFKRTITSAAKLTNATRKYSTLMAALGVVVGQHACMFFGSQCMDNCLEQSVIEHQCSLVLCCRICHEHVFQDGLSLIISETLYLYLETLYIHLLCRLFRLFCFARRFEIGLKL